VGFVNVGGRQLLLLFFLLSLRGHPISCRVVTFLCLFVRPSVQTDERQRPGSHSNATSCSFGRSVLDDVVQSIWQRQFIEIDEKIHWRWRRWQLQVLPTVDTHSTAQVSWLHLGTSCDTYPVYCSPVRSFVRYSFIFSSDYKRRLFPTLVKNGQATRNRGHSGTMTYFCCFFDVQFLSRLNDESLSASRPAFTIAQ